LKTVAGYHNADLSSLAKMALASIYRSSNRSQDAINIYKQLMQSPTSTVGKTAVEVQLAETYQDGGNTAEAKKQYEQIQKENPQSDAGQFAASKLQEMK
jgi:lipopolysaccharide biosynthesis regulator YciM